MKIRGREKAKKSQWQGVSEKLCHCLYFWAFFSSHLKLGKILQYVSQRALVGDAFQAVMALGRNLIAWTTGTGNICDAFPRELVPNISPGYMHMSKYNICFRLNPAE